MAIKPPSKGAPSGTNPSADSWKTPEVIRFEAGLQKPAKGLMQFTRTWYSKGNNLI
jgi:hypothetical protein